MYTAIFLLAACEREIKYLNITFHCFIIFIVDCTVCKDSDCDGLMLDNSSQGS